jgi:pimeloyl-ACP methyl ester carboxylesterase
MKPNIQKIAIPGLTLNARVWGPEDGQHVLALHGWLDNAASFDLLAPLMPQLRIVAIDFPGHGFSDHLPLSEAYDHVHRMLQMFQVADALGWDSFSILGHSLGGIIGLFMAGIFPERIEKIAVIDAIPDFAVRYNHSTDLVQNCRAYYLKSKESRSPHTVYSSIEDAADRRATTFFPMKQQSSVVLANGGMHAVPRGYSWTFDLRLLLPSLFPFNEAMLETVLKNVNSRLCLIVGKEGIVSNILDYREKLSIFKHIEIHELPGRHHLHLDEAESVAKILDPFFR